MVRPWSIHGAPEASIDHPWNVHSMSENAVIVLRCIHGASMVSSWRARVYPWCVLGVFVVRSCKCMVHTLHGPSLLCDRWPSNDPCLRSLAFERSTFCYSWQIESNDPFSLACQRSLLDGRCPFNDPFSTIVGLPTIPFRRSLTISSSQSLVCQLSLF